MRTVFIFVDLPIHVEFRAADSPLLEEGAVIEFDLVLTDPKNSKRTRKVEGPYEVKTRKLKYSTDRPGFIGLTQYLELTPS